MVFTRDCSRGLGERATDDVPVSSSAHSKKGIVNMPARLVPTVRSSASAAFPPTACARHRLHREGTQYHMPRIISNGAISVNTRSAAEEGGLTSYR